MIEIIKELSIEVTKPNIFQALVAKQYDMNTRFLKVTLMDCGTRIDVPNIETAKVVINAERKDGQSKGFDGVINEDGTVTVPLHSWMLELDGTVICDISVIDTATDDNKKLTTTSFTLIVEKAAYGGNDVTNDPQYDVLVELMENCQEANTAAQEALNKSNEALKKSAEADSKYDACVEATANANAVRSEIEAGGFIESLKEMNTGEKFTFWVGTQAEYDSIPENERVTSCFYIITDDKAKEELYNRDYIVKQGVSEDGMWTYRMWSNGVSECWASFIYNMTRVTISTNHYGYHSISAGYEFPEGLFIGMPFIDYNVGNDSGQGGLKGCGQGVVKAAKSNATKEKTGYLYVDFPAGLYVQDDWTQVSEVGTDKTYTFPEGQYLPIQVSIEAKGRWKEEE